jgi:hypothetical protein
MFSRSIRRCIMLAVLAVAVTGTSAVGGPFGPGNLVVVQVGADGGPALTSAATAVFLKEYAITGGSAIQSVALQTTAAGSGNAALTMSGTASSEGALARSTDGRYLTLAGYNADAGTGGVVGTTSATVNRIVGRVDLATGTVDTTTRLSDGHSGGNIRSAVTTDGTTFWTGGTGGATGGTRNVAFGSTGTSTSISNTPNNTRAVNIFNNQLYTSTMSGTFRGVNTVGNGLPTTSGQTTTLLPGFDPLVTSNQNVYAFVFTDANTLYVADERVSGVGLIGGVQKWTFDGTNWNYQYSAVLGAGAGARGLAVDANGVIYATTTETSQNRIVSLTDNGTSFSTATTLVTAGANTVFRGIAITPVPEPGSLLLCGLAGVGFAAIRRYRKRAVTA